MTRRSLLLGAPAAAMAQTKAHVGSQTNAWPIDPKDPQSLLRDLAARGGRIGIIPHAGHMLPRVEVYA